MLNSKLEFRNFTTKSIALSRLDSRVLLARLHATSEVLKRIPLLLIDVLFAFIVLMLLSVGFACPAYAYVDPSVLTYTIQALAGVVVALSAVAGVAWRRIRRKTMKKLGIDENAHKIVEPKVQRTENKALLKVADEKARKLENRLRDEKKEKLNKVNRYTWGKRLGVASVVILTFVFTFCFAAPCEIVAGSVSSLTYGLEVAVPVMGVFSLVVFFALTIVVSLLRGKPFWFVVLALMSLSLCFWIQSMFLNTGLPIADGTALNLSNHLFIVIVSLIVWVMVFVLLFFEYAKQPLPLAAVTLFISLSLMVVQGVGLASIGMNFEKYSKGYGGDAVFVTDSGINTLSAGKNVVVFVLDTFDTNTMIDVMEEDSLVADDFRDFVMFEDSAGSMLPTRYAIPNLLTGDLPQEGEAFSTYYKREANDTDFIDTLANSGIDVGIYTDTMGGLADNCLGKVSNIKTNYVWDIVDKAGTIQILLKCSLYREVPWVLKPYCYFTTDEVNQTMTDQENAVTSLYTMDDAKYHKVLKSEKISIDSDCASAFRFIHLQGSHAPYTLNVMGETSEVGETTEYEQTRGDLRIVDCYLDQLKEMGLYENTDVIVTADHGYWYNIEDDNLPYLSSPVLLVKSSKAQEMKTRVDYYGMSLSSNPVSQQDFQGSVLSLFELGNQRYSTTYFEDLQQKNKVRYHYRTSTDGYKDCGIYQYQIIGNVLEYDNWARTGLMWTIDNENIGLEF